jgi:predicted metalloprotease with PDZ domain
MILTGYLDGSKAIRYYDPSTCTIKASRNFSFNENDEPPEWEITTELPTLQSKGEQQTFDALQIQNLESDASRKTMSVSHEPNEQNNDIPEESR